MPISLPGLPPSLETRYLTVGPDFRESRCRSRFLAGRDIEAHDHPGTQLVVVINERFARLNFPVRIR